MVLIPNLTSLLSWKGPSLNDHIPTEAPVGFWALHPVPDHSNSCPSGWGGKPTSEHWFLQWGPPRSSAALSAQLFSAAKLAEGKARGLAILESGPCQPALASRKLDFDLRFAQASHNFSPTSQALKQEMARASFESPASSGEAHKRTRKLPGTR